MDMSDKQQYEKGFGLRDKISVIVVKSDNAR